MIPTGRVPVIHISQNDTGSNRLRFALMNGEAPYVPSGGTIAIQGTKPDGNTFNVRCTVVSTLEDSVVEVNDLRNITDVSGDVVAQIVHHESEVSVIGSQTFILRVQGAAYDNTDI